MAARTAPPGAPDGDDLETKPVLEWTKEDWSRWIARSPDEHAPEPAADEPGASADEPAEASELAGSSPEDVEWVTPEVAVPAPGTDEPVDEEEPPERRLGAEPAGAGEGGSDLVVAPDDRAPGASAPPADERDDPTLLVELPEAGRDRAAAELLEELAVPSSPPPDDGDPVADLPIDEDVPPVVGEVEPPPYPWFGAESGAATSAPAVPPIEKVAPPLAAGAEPVTTEATAEVPGPQRVAPSEPATAEADDDWSVDPGPGTTGGGNEPSDTDAPASWWSGATRAPAWPEAAPEPPQAAAAPPIPPVAASRPADGWDARAGGERTASRTSPVTAPRPTEPRPPEVRIERSHRVRSAFGLLGVAVLVGMVVAALITVAIFAISVALRRAIG